MQRLVFLLFCYSEWRLLINKVLLLVLHKFQQKRKKGESALFELFASAQSTMSISQKIEGYTHQILTMLIEHGVKHQESPSGSFVQPARDARGPEGPAR